MPIIADESTQEWNADRYAANARFVPALGDAVFSLLAPRAGEQVLDIACGDGTLTKKIAEAGATVIGIDASADMVAAARKRGLDARLMNAHNLEFDGVFDAVFSNAALHWMKSDPDAVIKGVRRALKPGGRFVAEMGGHGCVAAITVALLSVLRAHGVDTQEIVPWYFPTAEEYAERLGRAGFAVDYIALIPRPTPLPTEMAGWMETFATPFFRLLPADQRELARDEAIALLKPVLCDTKGNWSADYIRLRFAAHHID